MDVEVVASGDAALAAVAATRPDVIVLDLNPVLNGLEVCRILRARTQDAHVPIVMVTARESEDDRVTGLELGADDYITKPFSLRELTARVRAVLRRSASAGVTPPARVIARDRLLEGVWGYDTGVETRSVDVHVGRLRAKLGEAAGHIETVVGLGYRFTD